MNYPNFQWTGCGLRTVISIIRIFEEVIGDPLGKLPCYNSVANWVRKLGLSVYEEDAPQGRKYAHLFCAKNQYF